MKCQRQMRKAQTHTHPHTNTHTATHNRWSWQLGAKKPAGGSGTLANKFEAKISPLYKGNNSRAMDLALMCCWAPQCWPKMTTYYSIKSNNTKAEANDNSWKQRCSCGLSLERNRIKPPLTGQKWLNKTLLDELWSSVKRCVRRKRNKTVIFDIRALDIRPLKMFSLYSQY